MAKRSKPTPRASPKKSGHGARLIAFQAAVIILAVFWIYWPARHGGWISDDLPNLAHNRLLPDPNGLEKIWFQPTEHIEFYPIEETVQWLQWQSWGTTKEGYHLTNIALHALNALLVWLLFRRLKLRWAWLGGLLFAVHPIQVESVAWLSELKNVLSLAPFLLAMIFWIDYEQKRRSQDYSLALASFIIAMLCKISMATFPVVVLLYAWWKRGRIDLKDVRASIPFFMVSLVLGIITIEVGNAFHARYVPVLEPIPIGGVVSRLACAGLAASFYLKQCFWPVGLLPCYPLWPINPPSLEQFLPWPVFAGIFALCWTYRQTWGRHVLLGLGFFLIMIAPFLGFKTISFMSFTWVMDHFLYLPCIGLIGLLIAGLGQLDAKLAPKLHYGLMALLTTLILLLAIGSHSYAALYQDQKTLSLYTVKYNPGAWTAENNIGNALTDENRLMEAIDFFREALRIKPDYALARYNLANTLLRLGQYPEAVVQYQQLIAIEPAYPLAHNDLAVALVHVGRMEEAVQQIKTEESLYPWEAGIKQNLDLIQAIAKRSSAAKSSP